MVTDQAGKQRLSQINAAGDLTDIWEIKAADPDTVVVSFPQHTEVPTVAAGYQTHYEYDVLGDLKKVTQGGQTRTFGYDSLKRLKSASNPEISTSPGVMIPVTYTYDPNGNLHTKTDARGIITTFEYDALNRLKTKVYSDSTPAVTYTYDTLTNGKGKLTSVSNSVSATSYSGYDAMGRPTGSTQTTDGVGYSFGYTYNLAGGLLTETYPSGRTVTTDYDSTGRTAGVKNTATGLFYAGGASTDATNRIKYTAAGAIGEMKLGNGLWEHTLFNSRLQPTEIGLGNSGTDYSTLRLQYGYSSTDNNCNVRNQTITAQGSSFVQTYEYDELNRLKTSQEQQGGSTTWQQNFIYDRFGNRTFDPSTTAALAGDNPTISSLTNRVNGRTYDDAGNMIEDLHTHHSMGYDAENRMTSFDGVANSYTYDGDGKRIKKVINSGMASTVYVYDAMGQLAAEYASAGAAGAGTNYLTADTLGSTRVVTGSNGAVKGRYDYHPFGEQVAVWFGNRSSILGYSMPADVNQKFTSKERDNETGLDYSINRYYSSTQGRFTSTDPLLASGDPETPQSWNRYVYCVNDPLGKIDPNGLTWIVPKQKDGGQSGRPEWSDGGWDSDKFEPIITFLYHSMDSGRYFALNPYGPDYKDFDNAADASRAYDAFQSTQGMKEVGRVGRLPDAVTVSGSCLVLEGNLSFEAHGHVYGGGNIILNNLWPTSMVNLNVPPKLRNLPKLFKCGFSLQGVWLNQFSVPDSKKTGDILNGTSYNASYGTPWFVGGGETWSPGSGTATTLGVVSPGFNLTGGGAKELPYNFFAGAWRWRE